MALKEYKPGTTFPGRPVSKLYPLPFEFTGRIFKVTRAMNSPVPVAVDGERFLL
jgi:hypothetical protein